VNYDIARDIDTHTHRIGRTGKVIVIILFDKCIILFDNLLAYSFRPCGRKRYGVYSGHAKRLRVCWPFGEKSRRCWARGAQTASRSRYAGMSCC